MKSPLTCFAIAGAAFFTVSVQGSIEGANNLSIDFTKQEEATAKAAWSHPDRLAITANGLGWDAQAAATIEGWIHTKPLAVGLSWRPARSVGVSVSIEPLPKPILLNSGQTSTPYVGGVYARYSPDLKHWSSWQALDTTHPPAKDATGRLFTGTLAVPRREQREYLDLLEKYSQLDVPWVADEEASVAWILTRDAKFFERSLPFIGYVEFLFEAEFYGGQRITSLRADVGYGMSGLASAAKDPSVARGRNIPWRFEAH